MLSVRDAGGGGRDAERGEAGVPRRRQQRQVIAPINAKHPHATPVQRDRTVKHVCHGHDTPGRDRESGRNLVT